MFEQPHLIKKPLPLRFGDSGVSRGHTTGLNDSDHADFTDACAPSPSPAHRTMAQVLSLATQDMETVGASVHHHMSLEKPFRSRGGFDLARDGRLSPTPFRTGSGRKRASSINTAPANHGIFEPLSISTSGQATQDGPRDIICLCTPAPKIPRPRNGELSNPALIR